MSIKSLASYRIFWANLGFASLVIWLLLACHYANPDVRGHNYLLVLLGGLVGSLLGVYWAPVSATEQARFVTIGQAVGTFLSGYFLSKLDRLLEQSLFAADAAPQVDAWIRLGLFIAATILATLIVYTNRSYLRA